MDYAEEFLKMASIDNNWTDSDGTHQGGTSTGVGYTIAWQRGAVNVAGRNGAFLIEVLESCLHQLEFFQNSKFACEENAVASSHLNAAIAMLRTRRDRRAADGKLGTHEV